MPEPIWDVKMAQHASTALDPTHVLARISGRVKTVIVRKSTARKFHKVKSAVMAPAFMLATRPATLASANKAGESITKPSPAPSTSMNVMRCAHIVQSIPKWFASIRRARLFVVLVHLATPEMATHASILMSVR